MRLLIGPEAEAQIEAIDTWWRTNRPASPELFVSELAIAFDLIQAMPRFGRSVRQVNVEGLRRILLRATRNHVFYAPLADDTLVVLAVWSAVRGAGPDLRNLPGR